jgi:hypothetical protein
VWSSGAGVSIRARFALASAMLAASACLTGTASSRDGDLLPDARLEAIRDGESSRREVLDWFGPPLVVTTRSAETVRVPEVIGFGRYGSTEVPASSFFELFEARDIGPHDVVYFFRRHLLTTTRSSFAIQHPVGPQEFESVHRNDRLWVLVDAATGVVKAHVHRRDPPSARATGSRGSDGQGGDFR